MGIPTTRRRRWKVAIAIVAAVLLLLGGLWWGALQAFHLRFHPVPQKFALAKPADPAQALHQDLQVLAQLPRLDRSFSRDAAARFERERAALDARVAQLTPEEFEMAVSRLVAIAGNGHTTVVSRSRRINLIPLRFAWFAEGLFVTRAKEPYANLLGAQVIAIDGHAPAELLKTLQPFVSGTADRAKAVSPLLLQSPAALAGMGVSRDAASATYKLRRASGEVVTVAVAGEAPSGPVAYSDPARNYSPMAAPDAGDGWHALFAPEGAMPLALREPDASVYVQPLDHGHGLYVHLNMIMGDARGGLSQQLEGILDGIAPGGLRYAVLDLRMDGGGNYMETIAFTKELPTRIASDGKLFILTDPGTFSAAIVTLARAKYFAGSRAVVVGEHAGDAEQFWAESGAHLELPNSKIVINFATGFHDWANGCGVTRAADCFWFNLAYDVPAKSIAPDVTVRWRFADYAAGADTVIDTAVQRAALSAP